MIKFHNKPDGIELFTLNAFLSCCLAGQCINRGRLIRPKGTMAPFGISLIVLSMLLLVANGTIDLPIEPLALPLIPMVLPMVPLVEPRTILVYHYYLESTQ